jgi:RNA polymerase sigma-70 factor (ECF subfamily)
MAAGDAENAEALRLAVALLDRLDPDKREVFVLAQMEQMTVPEIAACLGVNVNTVYARLRAARKEFDAAFARHQRSSSRPAPPGKQP